MNVRIGKSCVALLLVSAAASAFCATPLQEPGAMLRDGTWSNGVGAYDVPQALGKLKPSAWPTIGWSRLTMAADHIQSERIAAPNGETPAFLRAIVSQIGVDQIETSVQTPSSSQPEQASAAVETTEWKNEFYLRVPGTRLREGAIPVYLFKNGTSVLRPLLDYRYTLKLGEQEFAFTVRNGLRTKSGAPYGGGAYVTVEYDGNQYEYALGGYGWDSTIAAIADLDGDGKPDFVFNIGASNSGVEAVLLSSKAKPGKNPATASLVQGGC